MLTIAKQRMKETMEELEQASSAVEIAKKKVGPGTGLALDVTMLLELLKPHMNALSMNAADIVARIEGDVKVVRMGETRSGIQLTQLDMPVMKAQEMASQIQAMEAMRQVEEEEEESKNRCGEEPKKKLSDGKPEQRGQQHHQGPAASKRHRSKTASWSCRDRLERARRDSENQHSKSGTRPLQAVLKECEETIKGEENRSAEGHMRGSGPDNRTKPRRCDSEFVAIGFDSTLGYPGEGPPRVPRFWINGKMRFLRPSLHGEYHVEETRESVRDAKM